MLNIIICLLSYVLLASCEWKHSLPEKENVQSCNSFTKGSDKSMNSSYYPHEYLDTPLHFEQYEDPSKLIEQLADWGFRAFLFYLENPKLLPEMSMIEENLTLLSDVMNKKRKIYSFAEIEVIINIGEKYFASLTALKRIVKVFLDYISHNNVELSESFFKMKIWTEIKREISCIRSYPIFFDDNWIELDGKYIKTEDREVFVYNFSKLIVHFNIFSIFNLELREDEINLIQGELHPKLTYILLQNCTFIFKNPHKPIFNIKLSFYEEIDCKFQESPLVLNE